MLLLCHWVGVRGYLLPWDSPGELGCGSRRALGALRGWRMFNLVMERLLGAGNCTAPSAPGLCSQGTWQVVHAVNRYVGGARKLG